MWNADHNQQRIRYQVSGMSAKNKPSAKDLNNLVTSTPVKPSKKLVKFDEEMESDLKKLYKLVA